MVEDSRFVYRGACLCTSICCPSQAHGTHQPGNGQGREEMIA